MAYNKEFYSPLPSKINFGLLIIQNKYWTPKTGAKESKIYFGHFRFFEGKKGEETVFLIFLSQGISMMNQKDALKLLEMSSNLATQAMQARTANGGQLAETEVKELFATCFDTVYEKFQTLPIAENAEEKFATIAEMHQIFAEKFAELEKREDKFATISEMHKIFSIKFAEIDRQQEKFSSIAEMHQIFAEKLVELERRDEKFATIAEMHRIFAEKLAELDRREEKFATLSEMHRIFAEKFAEIDQKLATLLPASRPMRRPV